MLRNNFNKDTSNVDVVVHDDDINEKIPRSLLR